MLESTNHASIVFICGGNAGIDLLDLVVGQFVDKFEPRAGPQRRDGCGGHTGRKHDNPGPRSHGTLLRAPQERSAGVLVATV